MDSHYFSLVAETKLFEHYLTSLQKDQASDTVDIYIHI